MSSSLNRQNILSSMQGNATPHQSSSTNTMMSASNNSRGISRSNISSRRQNRGQVDSRAVASNVNSTEIKHHAAHQQRSRRGRGARRGRTEASTPQYFLPHHHNRFQKSTEHKFSKQQFLQANCQFVVLDGYDHTIHKVDPDWPVDWDRIEEVKFRQIGATETTCPICLEQPIAAKITRCGHIYCWACMLRYLSMSEKDSVPCPICFEPIYVSDLRSVVSQSYANHVVGELISMKLLFRRKGCVEVESCYSAQASNPQTSIGSTNLASQAEESNPHYGSQANLIIVDPMTVVNEIARRESDELQLKMDLERLDSTENESENYSGMICFLEQALDKVKKRIERLALMSSDECRVLSQEQQRLTAEPSIETDGRSYFFYQAADGQHIYLNPFSIKVLCHEYGSLENCPHEIQAEILQMDWISMNETWRKRFKYLEHLPLSCEFRLIEIDLEKSNLVSGDTYAAYEEQIKTRAYERARRLREEAKRDKLIQVEQNRRIYGIQPSLEISLDNREQFPSVSNEAYLGLDRNEAQNEDTNDDLEEQKDDIASNDVTISFAQIQLQEARNAEKASRQHSQTSANPWVGSSDRSRDVLSRNSAPASSFAQLLVDAKTSQQKWTKSTHPSSSSQQSSSNVETNIMQSRQVRNETATDDAGEELRAPPCEFTISDYLELNVVSSRKKGKRKKT